MCARSQRRVPMPHVVHDERQCAKKERKACRNGTPPRPQLQNFRNENQRPRAESRQDPEEQRLVPQTEPKKKESQTEVQHRIFLRGSKTGQAVAGGHKTKMA